MMQAKRFNAICILTVLLSCGIASLSHSAKMNFKYQVRFNLILRGHPFDQFVPLTSGSPFLPGTMVAGGIEANGKPIGCVDKTGQVFLAEDNGQEKFNSSILLIIPAFSEIIFSTIALVGLAFLFLRNTRGNYY